MSSACDSTFLNVLKVNRVDHLLTALVQQGFSSVVDLSKLRSAKELLRFCTSLDLKMKFFEAERLRDAARDAAVALARETLPKLLRPDLAAIFERFDLMESPLAWDIVCRERASTVALFGQLDAKSLLLHLVQEDLMSPEDIPCFSVVDKALQTCGEEATQSPPAKRRVVSKSESSVTLQTLRDRAGKWPEPSNSAFALQDSTRRFIFEKEGKVYLRCLQCSCDIAIPLTAAGYPNFIHVRLHYAKGKHCPEARDIPRIDEVIAADAPSGEGDTESAEVSTASSGQET
jgi:hypothetical protein